MKNVYFLLLMLITSSSIANTTVLGANGLPETDQRSREVQWFRQSAERIALDREVFYAAEDTIQKKIKTEKLKPHTWGVVLDIDETVLDNSAWNEMHHQQKTKQTWDEFAAEAVSTSIPGAREFTQHIHQLGGYVNLVSNRSTLLLKQTKINLNREHIYYDQLLLDDTQKGTSFVDKNARYNAIIKGLSPSVLPKQNIVAWVGDNIQDFPLLRQRDFRNNGNFSGYALFGKTYFILPNPMYGSWEN